MDGAFMTEMVTIHAFSHKENSRMIINISIAHTDILLDLYHHCKLTSWFLIIFMMLLLAIVNYLQQPHCIKTKPLH